MMGRKKLLRQSSLLLAVVDGREIDGREMMALRGRDWTGIPCWRKNGLEGFDLFLNTECGLGILNLTPSKEQLQISKSKLWSKSSAVDGTSVFCYHKVHSVLEVNSIILLHAVEVNNGVFRKERNWVIAVC